MLHIQQKMKLLLFVGSGISLPSGMPSVQTIDDALLNEKWWHHSNGSFQLRRPEHTIEFGIRAERVQAFLCILKAEVADYFSSMREFTASYGDLHYVCCQIRDKVRGELLDPVSRELVKLIQRHIAPSPFWIGQVIRAPKRSRIRSTSTPRRSSGALPPFPSSLPNLKPQPFAMSKLKATFVPAIGIDILQGKTAAAEAARQHALPLAEVEQWS